MSIPHLVESKIKTVVNYNLKNCHNLKFQYHSLLFNFVCFMAIVSIIGFILYKKFKGHNNYKERKEKQDKKRDYILYNLRKFQNIKNKYITNIPFE